MALVNIKEMLEKARKEHYAVGAFDASTIEMAMAIVEAAEEIAGYCYGTDSRLTAGQ